MRPLPATPRSMRSERFPMPPPSTVLAIGATGRVGRLVVEEAPALGLDARAKTRSRSKAARRTR